jgi:hypothetical protein
LSIRKPTYHDFEEGKIVEYSESDMLDSGQQSIATIQTTDASPLKIFEIIPEAYCRGWLKVLINGAKDDGLEGIIGEKIFHFKVVAESITIVNTIDIVPDDLDGFTTATWELDVGDGLLRVKVTGEAGKTINWSAVYSFNSITTTSLP